MSRACARWAMIVGLVVTLGSSFGCSNRSGYRSDRTIGGAIASYAHHLRTTEASRTFSTWSHLSATDSSEHFSTWDHLRRPGNSSEMDGLGESFSTLFNGFLGPYSFEELGDTWFHITHD